MFTPTPLRLLTLLPLFLSTSLAQNASVLEINGEIAHLSQAMLVPQLTPAFQPQATIAFSFSGAAASIGSAIDQAASQTQPVLTFSPAANATAFTSGAVYTLMLVDANSVATSQVGYSQYHHWLINGVQLNTATTPYTLSTTNAGTSVIPYVGPAPPAGSGPHRYTFLLYSQPSSFSAPSNVTGFAAFPNAQYVTASSLGPVLAASYFTVANGTSTAALASTSAVVSSTLASAATTAAGTGTATGAMTSAGSATGSATSSAATAAATSAKSGAGRVVVGLAGGFVGVLGLVMVL